MFHLKKIATFVQIYYMKKSTCIHFSKQKDEDSTFYHILPGVEIKLEIEDTFNYSEVYYRELNKKKKTQFKEKGFFLDEDYVVWAVSEQKGNKIFGDTTNFYVRPK